MPERYGPPTRAETARELRRHLEQSTRGSVLGRGCQAPKCKRDAVVVIERDDEQLLVCPRCAGLAAAGLLK